MAAATLDRHPAAAPAPGENPYAGLIEASGDSHAEMQRLYADHRARRNARSRDEFLAPAFAGLDLDRYLLRLERPAVEPGFRDERNCLVLWARPPNHLLRLAERLQDMLRQAAPNVWLMPAYRMHLTTLEVAFSRTPADIAALVSALRPALRRFLDEADHDTPDKRAAWVEAVERCNRWLERHVWDRPDAEFLGEWVVGHEKGLDARAGTLWYGGGRTIIMGEGF